MAALGVRVIDEHLVGAKIEQGKCHGATGAAGTDQEYRLAARRVPSEGLLEGAAEAWRDPCCARGFVPCGRS